jgi:hypothetical protein
MKTKERGNRRFIQMFRKWTEDENKAFKLFHGFERSNTDEGEYNWFSEKQINRQQERGWQVVE